MSKAYSPAENVAAAAFVQQLMEAGLTPATIRTLIKNGEVALPEAAAHLNGLAARYDVIPNQHRTAPITITLGGHG